MILPKYQRGKKFQSSGMDQRNKYNQFKVREVSKY